MKEKKNKGARKFLLMAISVALVAAISVSATLAYLTAKTEPKTNIFQASGGIDGEVIEPEAEFEKFTDFVPGEEIKKDPTIDNDTKDYDIWTGAKLDFQIDIGDGSGYQDVSYDTFVKYVNINGLAGAGWIEYKSGDGVKSDGNKYYYYTSVLKADGGDTTEENYSKAESKGGTTGNKTEDNTTAIFTSVQPVSGIVIRELTQTEITDGATYVSAINANGPQKTEVYKSFKFKIIVTGYGVKSESTVGIDEAKPEILKGLGGYNG